MTHILALAFADEAFSNPLITPQNIRTIRSHDGQDSIVIAFKPEIMNTLIFRSAEWSVDGVRISPTRALTYNHVNSWFGRLGEKSGFEHRLRMYDLRRETATGLNGKELTGHSIVRLPANAELQITA